MFPGGKEYFSDLELVKSQLGRNITGFLKVAKRCRWGYPQVIMCYPLNKGRPFPTLYWLTCPYLNKHVGELESKGKIEEFGRLALHDPDFGEELRQAHREYASERFSLLGVGVRKHLEERFPSYLEVIRSRGIGGVVESCGVKCLHAHLAYYLVGGRTPVGRAVVNLLLGLECLDMPKCAVIEFCKRFRDHNKGG